MNYPYLKFQGGPYINSATPIINWRRRQIEIFRGDSNGLPLVATLFNSDVLTSPLLPNFRQPVAEVFS